MRVEQVGDGERLAALAVAWRALVGDAAENNKLLEPEMALPAWRHIEHAKGIDWLFVWRDGEEGKSERLIGVFALAARRPGTSLPYRSMELWRHALGFLGTPLVHRAHVEEAVAAMLDWLQAHEAGPRLLHLRQLAVEGPVYSALRGALIARGYPVMAFAAHARAGLASDLTGEDYLRASLGRKRLKEYRRLARRLGDHGALDFEIATRRPEIADAAEEFLTLERAGWKGRRGTALSQDAGSLAFFREAMAELADDGGVRVARLTLDGRAIASSILLVSGDEAWLWKIAFDEAHAHRSPGVLVILELTRMLLDQGEIRLVDSCATPDHPMLDHIWRERVEVTDLIAVMRPGAVPAAALFALVRAVRAMRAAAKSAVAGGPIRLRPR